MPSTKVVWVDKSTSVDTHFHRSADDIAIGDVEDSQK